MMGRFAHKLSNAFPNRIRINGTIPGPMEVDVHYYRSYVWSLRKVLYEDPVPETKQDGKVRCTGGAVKHGNGSEAPRSACGAATWKPSGSGGLPYYGTLQYSVYMH